jgi:hypothetical protein
LPAAHDKCRRHKAEGRAIWPRTCIGPVSFHTSSVNVTIATVPRGSPALGDDRGAFPI